MAILDIQVSSIHVSFRGVIHPIGNRKSYPQGIICLSYHHGSTTHHAIRQVTNPIITRCKTVRRPGVL